MNIEFSTYEHPESVGYLGVFVVDYFDHRGAVHYFVTPEWDVFASNPPDEADPADSWKQSGC